MERGLLVEHRLACRCALHSCGPQGPAWHTSAIGGIHILLIMVHRNLAHACVRSAGVRFAFAFADFQCAWTCWQEDTVLNCVKAFEPPMYREAWLAQAKLFHDGESQGMMVEA